MITKRYWALAVVLTFLAADAMAQPGNFSTSLHATRNGKAFWYGAANGGFEAITNVPIDSIGCMECHGPTNADGAAYTGTYSPNCIDCHPSNSAFNPDSIKVNQCLGCHGRQKTESMALGYTDVHRTAGMKCWDCHTSTDMHGNGTAHQSMLAADAISVDCEDCHTTAGGTLPDHSAYDPASHGGKIHCSTCHAKTVISCYNCHFESQVQTHIKRAKQTIHGFVLLVNREEDGKIYPATFQSLSYQGNSFAAFGPFTSHTIDSTGRTCTDCHQNFGGNIPAITEYNNTGEIYFAKWNTSDSTLTVKTGIVPMPADYRRSFKMDFITYNGSTSDPAGPSKNWSPIGKNTWDAHQMFFATPLTKVQMAKLGFDTTKVTAVEPGADVPQEYGLDQNYPNPFNPVTNISFRIPVATDVTLKVFNVLGAEVRTILAGQRMSAGEHRVTVDAEGLPSGIYLYKLSTPGFNQTRKMVVLK